MATVSSHILDAVAGDHGSGIRVELFRIERDRARTQLFDVIADGEGRVAVHLDLGAVDPNAEYELIFHARDYFVARAATGDAPSPADREILRVVVVRLCMPDPQARYHIPLVLSPHAYTIWWPA